MTTTTASSLTDLASRLQRELGNPTSLGPVVTRVLLRTGVNLRTPKPEQITDSAVVARVSAALAELGYQL
ncbi:MAG TPA: hypothetical protein VMU51_14955 [Mycobacteriales bacterium]|nr:hypothetical protein [Mycobacteriales bacterium]